MYNIDFSNSSTRGLRTLSAIEAQTGMTHKIVSIAFREFYDQTTPINDIYTIEFERFLPITLWILKKDIFIQMCNKYRSAINAIKQKGTKIPEDFTNLKMFIHSNPEDANVIMDFYCLTLYAKEEMCSGRDSSVMGEITKRLHEASNNSMQEEEKLIKELTEEEYMNIHLMIVISSFDGLSDDFFCYYIPMLIKFIYYLFKVGRAKHDFGESFARFVSPFAFFYEYDKRGVSTTFAVCENWIEQNKDSDNIVTSININAKEWNEECNEYTDILLNDAGFSYLSKDDLKLYGESSLRRILGAPFESDAVFQFLKLDEPLSLYKSLADKNIKKIYNMSSADFINKLFIKYTMTQGRLQKRVCNDIANKKEDSFNIVSFVSGFKTTLALALMTVISKTTRAELDEYKKDLDEKTANINERQAVLEEQENEFKKNKDLLEQRLARLEAQLEQKNKENNVLKKSIAIKDHQIRIMEHEIGEDSDDDIDDVDEPVANTAITDEDLSMAEQDVVYNTECLADMRIVFVGGQNNMLIRLQKKYPKWTYIGFKARGVESMLNNNTEMVVVAYNYIDHQTYNKAIALTPEDCPIVYVKKTNIDYIEQKILREKEKHENEVI